jgi:hypothetical protein
MSANVVGIPVRDKNESVLSRTGVSLTCNALNLSIAQLFFSTAFTVFYSTKSVSTDSLFASVVQINQRPDRMLPGFKRGA